MKLEQFEKATQLHKRIQELEMQSLSVNDLLEVANSHKRNEITIKDYDCVDLTLSGVDAKPILTIAQSIIKERLESARNEFNSL